MGTWATDGVTITVEIAFVTADPMTASPTWTDVSDYVRGITMRRGRWSETTRLAEVGECIVRLDNRDRRFDPLHTGGPYYPNVVPMKQIRIRATYSATTYGLWRGFIQEWPQTWVKGNNGTAGLGADAEVSVVALDAFSVLANSELPERYAMEVLVDDPVGYWRCDDLGNEMADSGSSGLHGAWSGHTARSGPIRVGTDGGRSLAYRQDNNVPVNYGGSCGTTGEQALLPNGTLDQTLECWLFLQSYGIGFVQAFDGFLTPKVVFFWNSFDYGAGAIGLGWTSEDFSDAGAFVVPAPRQVLHLVGSYDDSTGEAVLWVNGVRHTAADNDLIGASFGSLVARGILAFNWVELTDEQRNNATFIVSDIALYDYVLDADRVLAHYYAGKTGHLLERSGARVEAVLDFIGWPALRQISDGDSWLDVGPTAGPALDYLQRLVDTEQGRLFVSGAGEIVFYDRTDDMQRSAAITSQATFGDSGAELRYADLVLDGGSVNSIINEVTVTPQSGAQASIASTRSIDDPLSAVTGVPAGRGFEVLNVGRGIVVPTVVSSTVRDTSSIASYGRRAQLLGSLHANQGDARNLGLWHLARYSNPSIVVRELVIQPRRSPSTLFPQVLGREIGDRITVRRRPQGVGSEIDQERTIEGIAHEITPDSWTTTWFLCEPVPSYEEGNWWRVGDATYGVVGTAAVPY